MHMSLREICLRLQTIDSNKLAYVRKAFALTQHIVVLEFSDAVAGCSRRVIASSRQTGVLSH